ncbi:DUF2929 family protein [Aquibacillus koreensis]|uniref:DUF2929 family protein n=1 Tax=Aquibacillus koreensis TaxID=279446 RepID=UPI003A89BD1F
MRYFFTLLWAVLISFLVSYVLTSMAGETFTFTPIFFIALFFALTIFIIGDGILKEEKK